MSGASVLQAKIYSPQQFRIRDAAIGCAYTQWHFVPLPTLVQSPNFRLGTDGVSHRSVLGTDRRNTVLASISAAQAVSANIARMTR